MNNISVPQFFKDFTGNLDEFRLLLENLERGTAFEYGTEEEQSKLLEELHNGFVGIHPTVSEDSVHSNDLGEWFYFNRRYYHMNDVQGVQGTRGKQGPQGAQGIQGKDANIWLVQGLQGLQGTQGYPGMIVMGIVG